MCLVVVYVLYPAAFPRAPRQVSDARVCRVPGFVYGRHCVSPNPRFPTPLLFKHISHLCGMAATARMRNAAAYRFDSGTNDHL